MVEKTSGIEGLIEKLKLDGIAAGENARQQMLDDAKAKAAEIVAEARNESKNILEQAAQERSQLKAELDSELKLATRDFLLNFKQQLSQHLTLPELGKQVHNTLSNSEFAGKCLEEAISNYTEAYSSMPKVLLSDDYAQAVGTAALDSIRQRFSNGKMLEIQTSPTLSGFCLQNVNGQISWQVNEDSLVAALAPFVDKKLVDFLTPDINTQPKKENTMTSPAIEAHA